MPQPPHNRHDRLSPQPSAWIAAAVTAFWMLMFLRHPVWSEGVMPAGSEDNGPRWYLLLAPDGILSGWFQGPVTLAGLGQRAAVLAVAAVVMATAYAAGRPLVGALSATAKLRPLERHLLALATGLSVCSLVTLLVGLAGGVGRAWSAPVVAVISIATGWGVGYVLRRRPVASEPSASVPAGDDASHPEWAIWIPRLAAALLACLLIARAIMPPAEYDVREYHLQAPKEWSAAGRVTFMPHNIYANMPMGAELHALVAMDWWRIGETQHAWWWGALSGKGVIAVYALLAAGLIGCLVGRLCGRLAGTWTVVFGLATPVLVEGATLGLIEAALACYLAAGLLVMAVGRQAADAGDDAAGWRPAEASWTGFFAGSAIACKYPAVLFVALPLLVGVWVSRRRQPMRQRLAAVALFGTLAAVAGGPWLIKNALLAGNPVYPLAASLLGGETMTATKIAQWNAAHQTGDYSLHAMVDSLSRLSWRMQTQSMIVVPMALAGLIMQWRRREVRYAAIVMGVSLLLWWTLTHRVERFLVPTLPLVLVLAGFGWRAMAAAWGIKWLTAVAMLGIAVDGLLIAGPLLGDSRIAVDLRYLVTDAGNRSPTPLIPEHVRVVNDRLDDDDRLLLIGDAAVFDYAVPVDYATAFDRSPLLDIVQSAPPEQWRRRLRERGYTHVLVHWGEIQRLRSTYGFDERIDHDLFEAMQRSGAIEPLRMGLSGGSADLYCVAR